MDFLKTNEKNRTDKYNTEIKNSINGLSNSVENNREEDKTMTFTQSSQQRENRLEKKLTEPPAPVGQ